MTPADGTQLRKGEFLLWFIWTLGTLYVSATIIGEKLVLIYVYGWQRVRDQQLKILSMPRGRPWPLSNGDYFHHHSLHFILSLFSWFALFLSTYPFVRLLLPHHHRDSLEGR
jgi:hypothetical protein